jgi:hypothetical protein
MAFAAVTNNTDWAKPSFINPYVQAAIDRDAVAGASIAPALVSVGQDAHQNNISFLRVVWQCQLAGLSYSVWYDPDPAPSSYNDTDMSGFVAYASQAALHTAAGLTESGGFRRIPGGGSLPTDWTDYSDAAYSYGVVQVGDIVGPWLFADLQSLFAQMTRTGGSTSHTGNETRYEGYGTGATPAIAKAAAVADYQQTGTTGTDDPTSYSNVIYWGVGDYDANLFSRGRDVNVADGPSGYEKTASVLLLTPKSRTSAPAGIFDAQGEQRVGGAAIAEDVYNLVFEDTWTGTAAISYDIGTFGNEFPTQPPNWHPTDPDASTSLREAGWVQRVGNVIFDWNFDDQ